MAEIILSILTIIMVFGIFISLYSVDVNRKRGYDEGWDDCYKAYKQFEMSEDDHLVLDVMKKALKEYIRRKKYVKDEDRKLLIEATDFEQFKHVVFLTCVYRKEMSNRK